MIELILHVGMGKTGTTSIQAALQNSFDSLAEQKTSYLGMGFDLIDPSFGGPNGHVPIVQTKDTGKQESYADTFVAALENASEQSGHTTFILSNESLCANVQSMLPFLMRLKGLCRLRIVAYARNPIDWLPSAYHQWMIRHKTNRGRLMDFPNGARSLLGMYDGLTVWTNKFGPDFLLRPFEKGTDVVADFAHLLDLRLEAQTKRLLERSETSESILRAVYGDQHRGQVLPTQFNDATQNMRFSNTPKLADVIETSFTYSETDAILSENASMFAQIEERCGLDLTSTETGTQHPPQPEPIRDRLLDLTAQTALKQADRVQRLELRIALMKTAMEQKL